MNLAKLKMGERSLFRWDKEIQGEIIFSRALSCYKKLKMSLHLWNLKWFNISFSLYKTPLQRKTAWYEVIDFLNKYQYMSKEPSFKQDEDRITIAPKRKCLKNMMLSLWPCHYLKFPLMVWFYKSFRLDTILY